MIKRLILTLSALASSTAFAAAPSFFDFGENGCTGQLSFRTLTDDNSYFPPVVKDHDKFVLLVQGDIRLNGGYMKRQGLYHFDNRYMQGKATLYRLEKYPDNPPYPALITPAEDGEAVACLVPKDELGRYRMIV